MKLLVLGGTLFLGRALVEDALGRGHQVTVFNRGRTNPELFPEAEKLRGDRLGELDALDGREWDAALDVAAFLPRAVRLSTRKLHGRVGRYVYVSSISAYEDLSRPAVEEAALARLDDPESERPEDYGGLKAACERIVAEAFGERALIVRPGLIVGPHDPTDRFTYWPRRIAAGGRVLAPAPPDAPVQFIDVRDLAAWILDAVEHGLDGTFNATGDPVPFAELLETCRRGTDTEIVWVDQERLVEAGVGEWIELPLWVASPAFAAIHLTDVTRAKRAGLRTRPLGETVRDTLAWDAERETPRAEDVGLSPERERELLAGA